MKEEVGIAIKSKETSSDVNSQLEPVRNSYVTIVHRLQLEVQTHVGKCMYK